MNFTKEELSSFSVDYQVRMVLEALLRDYDRKSEKKKDISRLLDQTVEKVLDMVGVQKSMPVDDEFPF